MKDHESGQDGTNTQRHYVFMNTHFDF